MNDNLARRNLLGAVLSTMAVGALSAATAAPVLPASPDPIFPALAAWEAADRDVMRVYAETKGDDSPEADARCDAECRRRDAVGVTLGATTPTTLPGVLALARHYTATASDPESDGLTHLVAALNALARASPE
ncbi:hypothetical protein [Methylobacterium sp. SI9]|uniref:hypothetical protein n=1 Tax=Methylobacterium guangdongense TaxID=3138811 RepID=UPI00313B06DB